MVKNKIFIYVLLLLATFTSGAMENTLYYDEVCPDAHSFTTHITNTLQLPPFPAPESPRPFSGVNRKTLSSISSQESTALPLPPIAGAQPFFAPQEQANAASEQHTLVQNSPAQTQNLNTNTQSEKQLHDSNATELENETNKDKLDDSNETNNSDDNDDEQTDSSSHKKQGKSKNSSRKKATRISSAATVKTVGSKRKAATPLKNISETTKEKKPKLSASGSEPSQAAHTAKAATISHATSSSAASAAGSNDIQTEKNPFKLPENELVQTTNHETIVCEHCTKLQGTECFYQKKDFEYHFSYAHPALCNHACEKQCGHRCYTQELLDKHKKECTHTAQMDLDHNASASSSSAMSLDQGAPISHAAAQQAAMDTQESSNTGVSTRQVPDKAATASAGITSMGLPKPRTDPKARHNKNKCPHCCHVLVNQKKLQDHIEKHVGKGKHRCVLCNCYFKNKISLTRHNELNEKNHKEMRSPIVMSKNNATSSALSAEQVLLNAPAQHFFMPDGASNQQGVGSITTLTATHKLSYCPYCRFMPSTLSTLEEHNATDKHKQKVAQMIAARNHTFASASGSAAQPSAVASALISCQTALEPSLHPVPPKAPPYPPGLKEAQKLYYQRHLQGFPARPPLQSQYPKPY